MSELDKNHKKTPRKGPPEHLYSKKKIVAEVLIGFGVTILCNLAGIYFVTEFSDYETMDFLKESVRNGSISSVIALGALMDFLAFFVFLKKGQFYRVRGVLMGVIAAAFVVLYFKMN